MQYTTEANSSLWSYPTGERSFLVISLYCHKIYTVYVCYTNGSTYREPREKGVLPSAILLWLFLCSECTTVGCHILLYGIDRSMSFIRTQQHMYLKQQEDDYTKMEPKLYCFGSCSGLVPDKSMEQRITTTWCVYAHYCDYFPSFTLPDPGTVSCKPSTMGANGIRFWILAGTGLMVVPRRCNRQLCTTSFTSCLFSFCLGTITVLQEYKLTLSTVQCLMNHNRNNLIIFKYCLLWSKLRVGTFLVWLTFLMDVRCIIFQT